MTMPSGEAGLEPDAWLIDWITKNDLSGLGLRDRGTVEDFYKQGLTVQGIWAWVMAQFHNVWDGIQWFLDVLTAVGRLVDCVFKWAVHAVWDQPEPDPDATVSPNVRPRDPNAPPHGEYYTAQDVIDAWLDLVYLFRVLQPNNVTFWKGIFGMFLLSWTSQPFVDALAVLWVTLWSFLFGQSTSPDLDAAWEAAWSASRDLEDASLWKFILGSFKFVQGFALLVDMFFRWLLGIKKGDGSDTTSADLVDAFNRLMAVFEIMTPTSLEFWQGVVRLFMKPFTPKPFYDAVAAVLDALFTFLHKDVVDGVPADKVAQKAALDAAWDALDAQAALLQLRSLWRWLPGALRLLADISTLVDTFFKRLVGQQTQAELDVAFSAVMTDLGLGHSSSGLFWGVLTTWAPWLADVDGFFAAAKGLLNSVWDYIFGTALYKANLGAFTATAAANVGEAWRAFYLKLFPGNYGGSGGGADPFVPTVERQNFWNTIVNNGIKGVLNAVFEPLGGLGVLLNSVWEFVAAAWDYVFGGDHYKGRVVTGFSGAAGDNLREAWLALWGIVAPDGVAAPAGATVAGAGWSFLTKGINAPGNPGVALVSVTDALDSRIDHAETVTIPALDDRISHAENETIPALDARISHAENETIPAMDDRLMSMALALLTSYGGPEYAKQRDADLGPFGDLYSAGQDLAQLASSGRTLGLSAAEILAIRNNNPIYEGYDSTAEATFVLPSSGASAPWTELAPGKIYVGFVRISKETPKRIISWIGAGKAGLTGFYVYLYKMDVNDNLYARYASPNIISQVEEGGVSGADYEWNYHLTPTDIDVKPGDVYGIGFEVVGSGTYKIVGMSSWLPEHPYASPKTPGAYLTGGQSNSYFIGAWSGLPVDQTIAADDIIRPLDDDTVLVASRSTGKILTVDTATYGAGESPETRTSEIVMPVEPPEGAAISGLQHTSDGSIFIMYDDPRRTIVHIMPDGNGRWFSFSPDEPGPEDVPFNSDIRGMCVLPDQRIVAYDNTGHRVLVLHPDSLAVDYNVLESSRTNITVACLTSDNETYLMYDADASQVMAFETSGFGRVYWGSNGYLSTPLPTAKMVGVTGADVKSVFMSGDIYTDPSFFFAVRVPSINKTALCVYGGGSLSPFVDGTYYSSGAITAVNQIYPRSDGEMCLSGGTNVVTVDVANNRLVKYTELRSFDYSADRIVYKQVVPWVSWGMSSGDVNVPPPSDHDPVVYPDQLVQLTASGVKIPDWANTVHVAVLGGGSGGTGGFQSVKRSATLPNNATTAKMQELGWWFYPGATGNYGQLKTYVMYRDFDFVPGQLIRVQQAGSGGAGGAPSRASGTGVNATPPTPGGSGGTTIVTGGFSGNSMSSPGAAPGPAQYMLNGTTSERKNRPAFTLKGKTIQPGSAGYGGAGGLDATYMVVGGVVSDDITKGFGTSGNVGSAWVVFSQSK